MRPGLYSESGGRIRLPGYDKGHALASCPEHADDRPSFAAARLQSKTKRLIS